MPTLTPVATGDKPNVDITISDGSNTIGILVGGPQGFNPQSVRRLPRGAGAERVAQTQASWHGGRGALRLATDTSRFADSVGLWSMVAGKLMPGPQMMWGKFVNSSLNKGSYDSWPRAFPGDDPSDGYVWLDMHDAARYVIKFTAVATATKLKRVFVVLRHKSATISPAFATVNVELWHGGGAPPGDTEDAETTHQVRYYTNGLLEQPEIVEFVFDSEVTLSAGTEYYLRIYQGGTDADNCPQILGITSSGVSNYSYAGAGWVTLPELSSRQIVFHLDTDLQAYTHGGSPRPLLFEYKSQLYGVCTQNNVGYVYINGDRGVCTGTQAAGVITDTTKAWTANEWMDCVVLITSGAHRGKFGAVQYNTTTALTLKPPLDFTPATGASGTEYVILGSRKWTLRYTLAAVATDVVVLNEIAYLALGNATNMKRLREFNNAGVWDTFNSAGCNADDGANKADLLTIFQEGAKNFVYILNNSTAAYGFQRAEKAAWGTNLTLSTVVPVGDPGILMISITVHDYAVYVGKEDGLYVIKNGIPELVPVPIKNGRDPSNTLRMQGWNTNLYFPFMTGLERLFGRVVDDIGPDREEGMPPGMTGRVNDFLTVMQYAFVAYSAEGDSTRDGNYVDDFNDNTTPPRGVILATPAPGGAWHTLFRAPHNWPITTLFYQAIPGLGVNMLWAGMGDSLIALAMPSTGQSPANLPAYQFLHDEMARMPGMLYHWGGYLVTAWLDHNTETLQHFFDELRLSTIGLAAEVTTTIPTGASAVHAYNQVAVWYQTDSGNLFGGWTYAGVLDSSPNDTLSLAVTGRRIRFKLVLLTSTQVTPRLVTQLELRSVQMNEVQYDYAINFRSADKLMLLNGMETGQTAAAALALLNGWQENATRLTLRCRFGPFDNITGHLDPVPVVPTNWDADKNELIGSLVFKAL